MKRMILTTIALLIVLPGSLLAVGLGESAGHDLDALLDQAQSHYDFTREDAVILLESHQVALTHDGALQTRVHRVVWIGTAVGIRGYADLRIPWNTATSTLDVETLRTWREGRWWPDASKISDTAVVHTLPHALDQADDYTTMRETMLLHDGVELGCIMETAYTITEQNIPAAGGIFVVPQRDPAVLTELRVMARPGLEIQHQELNGMTASQSVNPTKGQGLLWQSRLSPALGQPVTSNPESYEPTVVWSTWASWQELGEHWLQGFNGAVMADMDLPENLAEKLHPAQSRRQQLIAVGESLNELVRGIHYSDRFWRFAPRTADRTLATAYGHDLDRAVLAASLLLKAGFPVETMFISEGSFLAAPEIPRLQDMGRVFLRLVSEKDACFDPAQGKTLAYDAAFGHPFWYVGSHVKSGPHGPTLPQPEKSLQVGMSIEMDAEGVWTGSGYFRGTAVFSHFGQVVGGSNLTDGYLAQVVGSVLPGAKVGNANPVRLEQDAVEMSFGLDTFEPQVDSQDRIAIVVGNPAGGLLAQLPRDVHLFEESRQTPVSGLENLQQIVTVRIQAEDGSVLHKPAPKKLENQAGIFSLEVQEDDGWLVLIREIKLAGRPMTAGDWPQLRALLLEEADLANGTILLEQ